MKIEKLKINSYGNLKEARERHNIIYLPNKNYVFVCSGVLTRTCEYTDLSKGVWEEIKQLNKIRLSASMAYINERYIYIFCGCYFDSENKKDYFLNDLEYFDINNFEKGWTSINFINEKRYNLSICAFGVVPISNNKFLICGGFDGKICKNETYKIDCNDYEHPTVEELNIKNNSIYIHNLFCKICLYNE